MGTCYNCLGHVILLSITDILLLYTCTLKLILKVKYCLLKLYFVCPLVPVENSFPTLKCEDVILLSLLFSA